MTDGHRAPPPAHGASWLASPGHHAWLDAELHRLLAFGQRETADRVGFGMLDARGRTVDDEPMATWVNARMVHVFALGHLRGVPGCSARVDQAMRALTGPLRDDRHGGWFETVGSTPDAARKAAYTHAFALLAGTSAVAVGHEDGEALLADAVEVLETRFWEPEARMLTESFAPDWTDEESYRGANSNMHFVEAALAAADATSDDVWLDRALAVAERVVDQHARRHGWDLVEHFDEDWGELPAYNADEPAHPFRPYGTTVGHWLEWSRLLLHLEAAMAAPPAWLREASRGLFDHAVDAAWEADGVGGFPYTLDWDGEPVVRARMHWVTTEAIAAAAVHARVDPDEPRFEAWYRAFWDHAATTHLDRVDGSWVHEVPVGGDHDGAAAATWTGKPDLYHAVQATLLPTLDPAPSMAHQLAHATA